MNLLLVLLTTGICLISFGMASGHPCVRKCDAHTPMVCKYHFQVETYASMDMMACYQCPSVTADCTRPHCIVAGGIRKNIVVVNRQFPGPTIEVCLGDVIEVMVENLIMNDESTTIHWHGQLVREDPYMDGVPFVTQCPIAPNTNFTYALRASEPGTHFWHSHEKMQRGDGMLGMLIVHVPAAINAHRAHYDHDLSDHHVMIADWTRGTRMEAFGAFVHGGQRPAPDGVLINGLGYMNLQQTPDDIDRRLPIARFTVKHGQRYRFRFVNSAFFDCPFTVSIDNHTFTVISADGHDIQPQTVDSFNIFAGERYDVILHADQPADSYWMRVKGLVICQLKQVYQVGVLHYKSTAIKTPPATFPTYQTAAPRSGTMLSALHEDDTEITNIPLTQLKTIDPIEDELRTPHVLRKYLKLSFNPVENPTSYRYPYYGFHQVAPQLQIVTPMINDIAYKDSPMPLLPYRYDIENELFCNNDTEYTKQNCQKKYCHCTHVIKLPMNKIIELIIFDDSRRLAQHPVHLHGYNFRVLAMQRLGNGTSRAEIQELDAMGLIFRNYNHPVRKDTVPVPPGGYVVLRFKTDNPGFWLFHCHVDIHSEDGMRMVFRVGRYNEMRTFDHNNDY